MTEFSVVITVYNKQEFLQQTLESVVAQSYVHFELIIVNDGSIDGSEEIIKSFTSDARIKYVSQQNQGAGAARNTGINMASKPYIALLDADDIWDANYLEIQKDLIKDHPDQSVFCTAQRILEKGKEYEKKYSIKLAKNGHAVLNFFDNSRQHAIIHSSSVVIQKEVFKKVGVFDPSIKSGQDTDLWIRIGLEYNVVFKNTPCVVYRLEPGSLFRSTSSLSQKFNPNSYNEMAKSRPDLKRFLDLNRYALAIQAKLWGEKEEYNRLVQELDLNHLNGRQTFLLRMPPIFLKLMIKLKANLDALGLRFTAYS